MKRFFWIRVVPFCFMVAAFLSVANIHKADTTGFWGWFNDCDANRIVVGAAVILAALLVVHFIFHLIRGLILLAVLAGLLYFIFVSQRGWEATKQNLPELTAPLAGSSATSAPAPTPPAAPQPALEP